MEPHFLVVGDFDGDRQPDLLVASRYGDSLLCYLGTGNGEFEFNREISVEGRVTELVAADINRKDGREDILVGVEGPTASFVRVYSSHRGALSAEPADLWLDNPVADITTGRLDSDHTVDLAIASGNQLLVLAGWDGRPDWLATGTVPQDQVVTYLFTNLVRQVVAGDLTGDTRQDVAALLQSGEIRILEGSSEGLQERLSLETQDSISLSAGRPVSRLLTSSLVVGKISTLPKDNLILTDPWRNQIRVVLPGQAWFPPRAVTNAEPPIEAELIDFDYLGTPVATLPLFLNRDALTDLVILGADPFGISVSETECSNSFKVNRAGEENDADLTDNKCDINLTTPQIHECTFKAAISQANSTPGLDCISFSGVSSVPGLHRRPKVTDSIYLNGVLQGADPPQNVVIQGEPGGPDSALYVQADFCTFQSVQISGFDKGGITLVGDNNKILDSLIGPGNLGQGIWVGSVSNAIERTTVEGNTGYGVLTSGSAVGNNLILDSKILNNSGSGIFAGSVATVEIIRNKVLGNGRHGVWMGTIGSTVRDNTIGEQGSGNKWTGMVVQGAAISILDNTISHNGTEGERGSGIELWGADGNSKNRIFGNRIFDNVGKPHTSQEYGSKGLGIDIYGDGVTPNDDQKDADIGPNGLQNSPLLTMRDDNFTIDVELHSTPNHEFEIEFFTNQACDPSGYGEGMELAGTKTLRTGADGNLICQFVGSCTFETGGHDVTATATDQNNNTSEFSKCASLIAPGGRGKVTILGSEVPLPQIRVNALGSDDEKVHDITDRWGDYVLDLDPGTYLITAEPEKGVPERDPAIRMAASEWLEYEDESVPMPEIEMGVKNEFSRLIRDAELLKTFGDVKLPFWLKHFENQVNRRRYADEMDELIEFALTQQGYTFTEERTYRLFLATLAAQSMSDSVEQHSRMIVRLLTDIIATKVRLKVMNKVTGGATKIAVDRSQNFVIRGVITNAFKLKDLISSRQKWVQRRLDDILKWAYNMLWSRYAKRGDHWAVSRALNILIGGAVERSALTRAGKWPERTLKGGLGELGTGLVLDAYARETKDIIEHYVDIGQNFVPKDDKLEQDHKSVFAMINKSRNESHARLNAVDQSWAGVTLDLVRALKDAAEVLEESIKPLLQTDEGFVSMLPWWKALVKTLKGLELTLRGGSVIYLAPALANTLPTELIAATTVAFGDTYAPSPGGSENARSPQLGTFPQLRSDHAANQRLASSSESYTNHLNEARRLIEDEEFDELITHIEENLIAADEELETALLLSITPIEDVAEDLLENPQTEQQYMAVFEMGLASSLSRLVAMIELCSLLLDASILSDEAYLERRQELFDVFDETTQLNAQMLDQVADLEAIAATIDSGRAVAAIHDVSASSNAAPVDLINTTPLELTISANVTNLSDKPISDLTASILSLDPDLDTTFNGPQSHAIADLGPLETREVTWELTFAGSLQLTALPLTLVLEADPSEVYTGGFLYYQIDVYDIQDSDLDGLSDAYEEANGLDPTEFSTGGDPDGDGLSNFMEFILATDPQEADTDGDGASDRREYDAGTDPLDVESFPTQNLYFPFYQGGNGSFTGFAVSNYSQNDVSLTFRALDAGGSLLSGGANPTSFDLSSESQLARLGHEIFQVSASTDHKGWVELEVDSPQIGSFFLFGRGNQMDGSVAIEEKAEKLYFTRVVDGESTFWGETADTYLALANPNDQSVTVQLTLMGAGEMIDITEAGPEAESSPLTKTRTIPAKGYIYEDVSELFETDFPILSGYVVAEVTQGSGVAGFEMVVLPEAETVIGLNAGAGDGSQMLYSAQLANGPNLFTDLNLVNTSDQVRTVTAIGIDQDGNELGRDQFNLQPGESMTDDVAFLFGLDLDKMTVGSIRVETDGEGVIGDVIFGEIEVLQYAAGLPLQTQTFSEAIFSHVAVTDGFFTGLALYNPGGSTAQVTIEVFSPNGQKQGETIFSLPPGTRTSQLVRELVQGLTEQLGGYIVIQSTQPLVAQQLFGNMSLDLLSSVPPTMIQ
jgi:hypothetical protein